MSTKRVLVIAVVAFVAFGTAVYIFSSTRKNNLTKLLVSSIGNGNDSVVIAILENNPILVNDEVTKGNTLLDMSIQHRRGSICKKLISMGADCKKKIHPYGSYLNMAIKYNSTECINPLLQAGVRCDIIDNKGNNALENAVASGDTTVVGIFISHGCDINTVGNNGRTPIFYADSQEMLCFLHSNGAHVNILDKYGMSPLHYEFDNKLVEILCRLGADVNINEPDSPIAFLTSFSQGKVLILSKYGANLNVRNSLGMTPLHLAVQSKHYDRVRELLDAGADIHILDVHNKTPFDYADPQMVKLIQRHKNIRSGTPGRNP
jgi:ankyrin repeat protein